MAIENGQIFKGLLRYEPLSVPFSPVKGPDRACGIGACADIW